MIGNGTISELYEKASQLYENPCDSCLYESDQRVALIRSSLAILSDLLAESTRQQVSVIYFVLCFWKDKPRMIPTKVYKCSKDCA